MSQATRPQLPPNPYKRSPIRNRENLAGRAREQKMISYYLNLTASGQSPHLALIGQRGVGKTSLLNIADSIAKDFKLLTIRLDMNELKAKSLGRFWLDLYQTLALSMAKAGCWGGIQGTIYAELLQMLYSHQPGDLQNAVMQVPFVYSCHQGNIDSFECPDCLVLNDFDNCLSELKTNGYSGIAVLIDEADCLGINVPLLQMFRNIFQAVDCCSLILAGTEAVFPALSEVFSPIPRQFHRIDVKPFTQWSDTRELVLNPIAKDLIESIAPKPDVLRELHALCGGAPDEVQLYCHHMYRTVEDGSSQQMALSPQVFRHVLHEYRSHTPSNVETIFNAIEKLPDKLLYESKWVSRRSLTLDENIQVTILRRELSRNKALSEEEKLDISTKLTEGYRKLFEDGIIENNNYIQLTGSPLTAGFWKSFVNVEREKRWSWNDSSFADNICLYIMDIMGKQCGAVGAIDKINGREAVEALKNIREGKAPSDFDEGMREMILSALFAKENILTHAVDVTCQFTSPAGKHTVQYRYFEKEGVPLARERLQEWADEHQALLDGNGISILITAFDHWMLPSADELHRLGYISGYQIPEVFGQALIHQAIETFRAGEIDKCAAMFSQMLGDRDDDQVRNNLAFCQLLMGKISEAVENSTKVIAKVNEPLYIMNKGIGEFLQGNVDIGKQSLRTALEQSRNPINRYDMNSILFVLVLEPDATKVAYYSDFPLDAAIHINLWRMGDLSREDLEGELIKSYPEKAPNWLSTFGEL